MPQVDLERAKHIYNLIRIFPGIDRGTLRMMMDLSFFAIESSLQACDNNGMLLSEDEHDRLYVWDY